MNTIITLTTDFGQTNEYVGVMKGVVLSRAPAAARIVDLTHGITGQAVQEAAYLIDAAYGYFPKNTIHVVVVDPGVGGRRRIVLLCADGHIFIAPDNGVLTLLLTKERFEAAYAISKDDLFLKPLSNTFHGRDIMAPVAAYLASGLPANEVGRPLSCKELVRLSLPEVQILQGRGIIQGAVVSVDRFGNLITNIHQDAIGTENMNQPDQDIAIKIRDRTIQGLQTSYDSVPAGGLIAIFGSRNSLEIAANQANAAQILGAGPGDRVEILISSNATTGRLKPA